MNTHLWYDHKTNMFLLKVKNPRCAKCNKIITNVCIVHRSYGMNTSEEWLTCVECKTSKATSIILEKKFAWMVSTIPRDAFPVLDLPPLLKDYHGDNSLFLISEYKTDVTINKCRHSSDFLDGAIIGKPVEEEQIDGPRGLALAYCSSTKNDKVELILDQAKKATPLLTDEDERRLLE